MESRGTCVHPFTPVGSQALLPGVSVVGDCVALHIQRQNWTAMRPSSAPLSARQRYLAKLAASRQAGAGWALCSNPNDSTALPPHEAAMLLRPASAAAPTCATTAADCALLLSTTTDFTLVRSITADSADYSHCYCRLKLITRYYCMLSVKTNDY